jgi:hypothetical protein
VNVLLPSIIALISRLVANFFLYLLVFSLCDYRKRFRRARFGFDSLPVFILDLVLVVTDGSNPDVVSLEVLHIIIIRTLLE